MKHERFGIFAAMVVLSVAARGQSPTAAEKGTTRSERWPAGSSSLRIPANGTPFDVFTYRPPEPRADRPMVLVIHGTLRNAEEYRDHTKPFADRLGCDLAAPRFDRERFPSSKFQQGGLFDESGRVQAKKEWTWTSIPELAQELNERAGTPNRRYVLLGHSAGGQLVGRMAAFLDAPGSTYIAANPSSWVFPHRDWDYPYGFGGLPEDLGGDAAIERYLARPLVIYLGTGDTERDEYLDKSAEADRQGQSRLARGRAFFDAGSRLATERGWAFGWRKVEAEGVAHDHEVMFNHLALDRILVATPTKSGG